MFNGKTIESITTERDERNYNRVVSLIINFTDGTKIFIDTDLDIYLENNDSALASYIDPDELD